MFSTTLKQSQGFGQNFRFPEGGIDGGNTGGTTGGTGGRPGGQHFEEGDDDDLYN